MFSALVQAPLLTVHHEVRSPGRHLRDPANLQHSPMSDSGLLEVNF